MAGRDKAGRNPPPTRTAERWAISRERNAAELAKIAYANIEDYTRLTPDGDRVVDLRRTDRDQLAAVGEILVEDFKDGRGEQAREVRRVRFKLRDKIAALDKLNEMMGWKIDRHEVGPPDSMLPVETEEELVEKLVNKLVAKGMTEAQALEFLRDTESGEWGMAPDEGRRRRDQR